MNNKPMYHQIDGQWRLQFTSDNKWIITKEGSKEEPEEIYIQHNNKMPELTVDKWKYPSHKVSLVHSVPCCKTMETSNGKHL